MTRLRAAAAASALLWLVAAWLDPARALRAYLLGWDFWLGLSAGCLGLALLHQLTGGAWGRDLAPAWRAGLAALPAMAALSLPVLVCAHRIYPWAGVHPPRGINAAWLNAPFFAVRGIGYLSFYCLVARRLSAWTAAHPDKPWPGSAPALIGWFLAASFAGIDWLMSLEAPWTSAAYGAANAVAYALSALAAGALLVGGRPELRPVGGQDGAPRRLQDLGNLLLAFVLLSAYLAFSQYLILWSANLPEEIPWYLRRSRGGWHWLTLSLALFHLAAPLGLLLMRRIKRDPRTLAFAGLLVLVAHAAARAWLILPAFLERPAASLVEPLAWLAVAAVWCAAAWPSLAAERPA